MPYPQWPYLRLAESYHPPNQSPNPTRGVFNYIRRYNRYCCRRHGKRPPQKDFLGAFAGCLKAQLRSHVKVVLFGPFCRYPKLSFLFSRNSRTVLCTSLSTFHHHSSSIHMCLKGLRGFTRHWVQKTSSNTKCRVI